jgi:glycine/serine hydroxymethyltransferase
MKQIAVLIHKVLADLGNEKAKSEVSGEVAEISRRFPPP